MDVSTRQALFNRETRDRWDFYRSHRNKVSESLAGITDQWFGRLGSLAILGAGNGNDLDLKSFANHFKKIHLFDFDPEALSALSERHLSDPKVDRAVVVESPVDLSGIADDLSRIAGGSNRPSEAEVLALAAKAKDPQSVLPGKRFDVVVSSCMMTQILAGIVESFGDDSPFKDFMMIAARDGHLQLMSKLLKPGGYGLLVSDFVSSDTLPEMEAADSADAALVLSRKAIGDRNFFTGTNPWAVKDALSQIIPEQPENSWTIAPPWRWQIGERRYYLVSALQFSKPVSSG